MKKRVFSLLLVLVFCMGISMPVAYAADSTERVETRFTTSTGVLVRYIGDEKVNISEGNGSVIINGEEYLLGHQTNARSAVVPTSVWYLTDGTYTQKGSLVKNGSTYSNKVFSPAGRILGYDVSASCSGGSSGGTYLFSLSLFDASTDDQKEAIFLPGDVTSSGKITWDDTDAFRSTLTGLYYIEYGTSGVPASTSYTVTIN